MKKICLLIFLAVVLTLSGCEDMRQKDVTVSAAKGLRDGALVRLTGTIVTTVVPEMYLFSDSTGDISIEIDNEVWVRSGIVNIATLSFPIKAEIEGEVDNERGSGAYIDVTRVKIIN